MKKIILISVGALVLIVVVSLLIVFWRLDNIVRRTVESETTTQLNLSTTLQDADVSVFGGSVTLDDMAIANPEGYTAPTLFELGQVNVGVSYGELTDKPVRISSVNIASPRLVIERGAGGLEDLARINLRELLERLQTDPNAETTKLIIDQLTVSGAEVVIRPNVPGLEEQYVVTIPDVTLSNIGTADEAQNGAEIGRVTVEVVMALARQALADEDLPPEVQTLLAGDLKAVAQQYADKLSEQVQSELQEELGDLGGELGGAADKVLQGDTQGAAEEVQRQADEAIRRGIGDLLGGDKQESEPQPE